MFADFSGLVSQNGIIDTVNIDLDPKSKIQSRATRLALAEVYSDPDKESQNKALAASPFNRTRDTYGQLLTPLTPFVLFQGDDNWAISTTTSEAPDSKIEADNGNWRLRIPRARFPREDCFLTPWDRKHKEYKHKGRVPIIVGREAVRDFFFSDGVNGHQKLYPADIDQQTLEAWANNLGASYSDKDLLPSLGQADLHLGAYIHQGVAEYTDAVRTCLAAFIRKNIVKGGSEASQYLNLLTPLYETRELGYLAGVDCVAQTIVDLGTNEAYRGSANFEINQVRETNTRTLIKMGTGHRTVKGDSWNLNKTRVQADILNRELAILEARP
jgi:hypothetical protein